VWWPRIVSPLMAVLQAPTAVAMVKAACVLALGKVAFYMAPDNPLLPSVFSLLCDVSTHPNDNLAEPACFALSSVALSHSVYVRIYQTPHCAATHPAPVLECPCAVACACRACA
jgi:hypothetical protein